MKMEAEKDLKMLHWLLASKMEEGAMSQGMQL